MPYPPNLGSSCHLLGSVSPSMSSHHQPSSHCPTSHARRQIVTHIDGTYHLASTSASVWLGNSVHAASNSLRASCVLTLRLIFCSPTRHPLVQTAAAPYATYNCISTGRIIRASNHISVSRCGDLFRQRTLCAAPPVWPTKPWIPQQQIFHSISLSNPRE